MSIRALSAPVAAAMLAACAAASSPDAHLHPQQVSWATYQHSPDRNAVFENYSIPHDWSYNAKAKINSGFALVGNTLLFTTFSHKLVAVDVHAGAAGAGVLQRDESAVAVAVAQARPLAR